MMVVVIIKILESTQLKRLLDAPKTWKLLDNLLACTGPPCPWVMHKTRRLPVRTAITFR